MSKANDCLQWAVGIAMEPRQGELTEEMQRNGEAPMNISDAESLTNWRDSAIMEARELTGVSPLLVEPATNQTHE